MNARPLATALVISALGASSLLFAADKSRPTANSKTATANAGANSSASAAASSSSKTAAKNSDPASLRKLFADYRDWKPINDEPIYMSADISRDCAAPRAADRRNPHEGAFVTVYVNEQGRDTYLADKMDAKTFAPGTVIVKEKLGQKGDEKPRGLGVMIKHRAGYDPKSGDWQFLYVDDENELVTASSKLTGCADCHRKQTEADYTFGPAKPDKSNSPGY